LGLLREAVAKEIREKPSSTTTLSSFNDILSSKLFCIPTSDPPLLTLPLDELANSMWLGWLIEVLNLVYLLLSNRAYEAMGVSDEKGLRRLSDELLEPVGKLREKWRAEAAALVDESLRNHLSTSLFAIDDAFDRISRVMSCARIA